MGSLQFTNNAKTTLAGSLSASATTFGLTAGGGALFPATTGGNTFIGTITKNGSPNVQEIVLVTGLSGDTITSCTRAYEAIGGVQTALTWNAGDTFSLNPTAAALGSFASAAALAEDVTTLTSYAVAQGPNYCVASVGGTANNIVCAWAAGTLESRTIGMPLRFLAIATNNGPMTLNDGGGALPLYSIYSSGSLPPNAIQSGKIYEVMFDGYGYQLTGFRSVRGTFELGLTGVSGSSSSICTVTQNDNIVTLQMLGAALATPNATTMTLTGLPSAFQTVVEQKVPIICTDYGQPCMAMADFGVSSSTIVLSKLVIVGGVPQFSPIGWSSSGTGAKGVQATTISYLLT
jgi:hypothetical protein